MSAPIRPSWAEQTGPAVMRYCLNCKRVMAGREVRYHDFDGSPVIQKECSGCGGFFSRTKLPKGADR